jgi:hypothetical protein
MIAVQSHDRRTTPTVFCFVLFFFLQKKWRFGRRSRRVLKEKKSENAVGTWRIAVSVTGALERLYWPTRPL